MWNPTEADIPAATTLVELQANIPVYPADKRVVSVAVATCTPSTYIVIVFVPPLVRIEAFTPCSPATANVAPVIGSLPVVEEARVEAGVVVDGRSTGGIVLGRAGQVCDGRPPVEGFGVDDS